MKTYPTKATSNLSLTQPFSTKRQILIRGILTFCIFGVLTTVAQGEFQIGRNFKGTDREGLSPPDTMGAVGREHIVELLNTGYRVYDKNGSEVQPQRRTLSGFFNQALINNGGNAIVDDVFDPRVVYDKFSGRWYAIAAVNRDAADSGVAVAVTSDSDPSRGDSWQGFVFDGDTENLRWIDFPMLGYNREGVFISTIAKPIPGNPLVVDAVNLFTIPKSSLTAATPSSTGLQRFGESVADVGGTVQPAVHMDNGNFPHPLLSDFELFTTDRTPGGRLKQSSFSDLNTLDLSHPVITTAPKNAPPQARQPGPADNIENRGTFTGNVVLQDGFLYAVNSVEANGRSAIQMYMIDPAADREVARVLLADPELDYTYPSIAVNDFGDIAIGFTASGDDLPLSAYAAVGKVRGLVPRFDEPIELFRGDGTKERVRDGRNRWGDYSATVVDPANEGTLWTFQQYINGNENWAIRIVELTDPSAPVISTLLQPRVGNTINREELLFFPDALDLTGVVVADLNEQQDQEEGTPMSARFRSFLPPNEVTFLPDQAPVLLDDLLMETTSDLEDGEFLQLVQITVDPQLIAERGLLQESLQLLHLGEDGNWELAVDNIANRDAANIEFVVGEPQFELGSYGFDPQTSTVWAAVDVNGYFGVAGVPEPSSLAVVAASSLLLRRRLK